MSIRCLRPMRDGTYFFVGDLEGNVTIYRPNIEKMLAIKAHVSGSDRCESYPVTSIAACPTNFMFCSAAEDANIKVWDLKEISQRRKPQKPIRKFIGHGGTVLSLDWHPKKGLI